MEYLERICKTAGLDYLETVPKLEALTLDFKDRLKAATFGNPDAGVFILPGGGGTNSKIYDGAFVNIDHLLVVFAHVNFALYQKTLASAPKCEERSICVGLRT